MIDKSPKKTSILSFNLLGIKNKATISRLDKRLTHITDFLRQSSFDIVCLQEVSYPVYCTLESFCHSNSMELHPPKSIWKDLGQDFIITVLLSRYKVSHSDFFSLPPFVPNKNYTMNFCRVHKLWVANIHLFNGYKNKQTRLEQLLFIIKKLKEKTSNTDPLLLCGDFNTDFDHKDSSSFIKHLRTELSLVDLWQILHPKTKGPTQDPQKNPLRLLIKPNSSTKRVDAVFIRDKFLKAHKISLCLDTEIFKEKTCLLNKKNEAIFFPSDHFAVAAEILYFA